MSWIYDTGDDGYGEPTVPMPRLRDSAILDIALLIEAAEESSDETLTEAARYLGYVVEDYWDHDIRVVTYEIERAYGGPEEGGWWWDAHHTVAVSDPIKGDTWTDTVAAAEEMAATLRAEGPKHDPWNRFGEPRRSVSVEVHPQGPAPEIGHRDVRQPDHARPRYC